MAAITVVAAVLAGVAVRSLVPRPRREHVAVMAFGPGTAAQLEASVAEPLEAALDGLEGLRLLETFCLPGRVRLDLELGPGPGVPETLERLQQRLEAVAGLPAGVAPIINQVQARSTYRYILSSADRPMLDLGGLHERLATELLKLPGVSGIQICGPAPEWVVAVDPARAEHLGAGIEAVEEALVGRSPSPSEVQVVLPPKRWSPEELLHLPLRLGSKAPVSLEDVAVQRRAVAPAGCRAFRSGAEVIESIVGLREEEDERATIAKIEAWFRQMGLPSGVRIEVLGKVPVVEAWSQASSTQEVLRAVSQVSVAADWVVEVGPGSSLRWVAPRPRSQWPGGGPDPVEELTAALVAHPGLVYAGVDDPGHGVRAIRLRIAGQDLEVLERLARQTRQALLAIRDARLVPASPEAGVERLVVDRERAARLGVDPARAVDAFAVATEGRVLAALEDRDLGSIPVRLRWTLEERAARDLSRIQVEGSGASRVTLDQVAKVQLEKQTILRRQGHERFVEVVVEVDHAREPDVRRQAAAALGGIALPQGVHLDWPEDP